MKPSRSILALLGVALALLASACGGGSQDVPTGSIAVVDGTEITRDELDSWLALAKRNYEGQKREFPKAGSPEYQTVQTQWVAFLVQREEFEQTADELGITVTEKDVDAAFEDALRQYFDGDRKKLAKGLKEQGFTEDSFREYLRATTVIPQKIYEHVTKDVKVSDAELRANYTENASTYQVPESREVRHILIAEKNANGQVDYAKSKSEADRIYAQLQGGASFGALAKEHSADEGTATQGGKYTAIRGATVPEFEKKVFELKTGEVSQPVKTSYGYHVIEALSDVKPGKTTPFEQVKETIRTQLLQQKRQDVMNQWVDDLNKSYKSKISYATGFAPPEIPSTPTDTATE
jgi:foldase protein PrsA